MSDYFFLSYLLLCCYKGDDDGQHAGGEGVAEPRSGSQRCGLQHRDHPAARRGQDGLPGHGAAAGRVPGEPAGQGQCKLSARGSGRWTWPRRRGRFSGVCVRSFPAAGLELGALRGKKKKKKTGPGEACSLNYAHLTVFCCIEMFLFICLLCWIGIIILFLTKSGLSTGYERFWQKNRLDDDLKRGCRIIQSCFYNDLSTIYCYYIFRFTTEIFR